MSQSRGSGNINLSGNQYYSSSSSRASNYANAGTAGGIVGIGSSTGSGSGSSSSNMPFQNIEYRGHAGGSGSGSASAGTGAGAGGSGSGGGTVIGGSNSDPFFQHNIGSAFQDIHPLPQLSPSSSSSSSTGRTEADRDNLWYFTADQLANSPSRRNGIDTDQELSYRQMTACLIQEMGQRLQV